MNGGLHNGRDITFFQTFDRFVWRSTSKFNNGWWSISHYYGCLLQTNIRLFKEFFMIESIITAVIIILICELVINRSMF